MEFQTSLFFCDRMNDCIALLVGAAIVVAGLYGPSRNFQETIALLTTDNLSSR
jgi:hypothetical protein